MPAKKRKTRTRTVIRTVRRGIIGKGLLGGIIAGAISSFIPDDAIFGLGDALGVTAVGYFMNNKTLQTLGGFLLGGKLIGALGGIFGHKGTSPSGFL